MARGSTQSSVPAIPPSASPEQGIDLLNRQGSRGVKLLRNRPLSSVDYAAWEAATENYLIRVFGSESANVRKVMSVGRSGSFPMNPSEEWLENHRAESLAKQLAIVRSLIEVLETDVALQSRPPQSTPRKASQNEVFLIHGKDESNLFRLHKLLRDHWRLDSIILRYEPGKGRTLIEKFEEEALEAGYAFALFTSDDIVETSDAQYFQARPNVFFELGWFFGRLGRERVCMLFKKGTKIPSDLEGITRIEFGESVEEKVLEIEAELQAAGLVQAKPTD